MEEWGHVGLQGAAIVNELRQLAEVGGEQPAKAWLGVNSCGPVNPLHGLSALKGDSGGHLGYPFASPGSLEHMVFLQV